MLKKQKNLISLSLLFFSLVSSLLANDTTQVDINFDVKHIVGDISSFDRKKFINIHSDITEHEWNGNNFTSDLRDHFLNTYDVYLGRNTGGISWYLNARIGEDPNRPGYANPNDISRYGNEVKQNYGNNSLFHQYEHRNDQVICAQLHPFYPDGKKTNTTDWAFSQADTPDEPFGTATGEYMGRYIQEFFGTGGRTGQAKPNYLEVINEPLWHLVDYGNEPIDNIFHFHNAVAKEVKKYHPDMPIGGYCTAFPDHENNNFKEWEDRWMSFMDIAGENMDFWTIHLYDFPSINNGKKRYRKGSNMEATFDMMEQYSFLKFNEVKPFMISEFGAQMHDYFKQWSPYRDWLFVKSVNSMLMQFMERANIINKAIPFVILKAEWGRDSDGTPYNSRLLRQAKEMEGEEGEHYVYTDFVKIYELWSDVKGTRVDSHSSDIDVLTDTYVDGQTAYVILNNLKFEAVDLKLNLKGLNGNQIENVEIRHLYLDGNKPVINTTSGTEIPERVKLESEATMIISYSFANEVNIEESNIEEKLYADAYFKKISANETQEFHINNVHKKEMGEAILRIGLGRDHGKSLSPKIIFNGKEIEIPINFRGGEQKDRAQFFGVLEIPVPYDVLESENTVAISFPDNGGHISSVALQNFQFSREITRSEPVSIIAASEDDFLQKKVLVYPNPTQGSFNLSTPEQLLGHDFEVCNTIGQVVMKGSIKASNQQIEIKDFSPGLYILKFDNEISEGIRIVVE